MVVEGVGVFVDLPVGFFFIDEMDDRIKYLLFWGGVINN